jgi:hypothetical protein
LMPLVWLFLCGSGLSGLSIYLYVRFARTKSKSAQVRTS